MRLLSSKKEKSVDPLLVHHGHAAAGGSSSGGSTPISSKSERGGTKARSSLTKLLNGIDRSYHGSKFSPGNRKYGSSHKDSSAGGPSSVAELLHMASSKDKSIDEEEPYETSTSPETIRGSSTNGHEQHELLDLDDNDDHEDTNDLSSSPRRRGRKDGKPEQAGERRRWTIDATSHNDYHSDDNEGDLLHEPNDHGSDHRSRERTSKIEDRRRSERDRYDVSPEIRDGGTSSRRDRKSRPGDSLRKSRHGGADPLRSSRHGGGVAVRSSTGDLSRSRHGGGSSKQRNSAGTVEDLLSKSRHGGKHRDRDRDRSSKDRKKSEDGLRKSRHGRSSGGGRVEAVVDALRRSLHGDDGEDGLRRSRHGSSSRKKDGLSKSRHGDSLSKSRHGDSLSKSRHGGRSSMSKSRHGGSPTKAEGSKSSSGKKDSSSMRKSRHGGRGSRSEIKDLLAPSRHGARLSTDLTNDMLNESTTTTTTTSVCCVCGEPAKTYLQALNKKFHHECFNCVGCHEPIDPAVPFTYMSEGGEKHPLHMSCHSELYGMKCTVCLNSIPAGADGKIKYTKHPFFSNEVMCPTHVVESVDFGGNNCSSKGNNSNGTSGSTTNRFVRRCTSCHRFEPFKGKGFLDLGDLDRCVCMACCRTIVCDSVDAQPLWRKVLRFWEKSLNMPIWEGMKEVPILVVGSDVMTEQVMFGEAAGTTHHHSGMTRGLCLSEQQATSLPASVTEDGKPLPTQKSSELTAILCLTGLPSDLTASVLAHEAMHAWFKLHPEFGASERAIPAHVEEGCAQLIAHLYLTEREQASSSGKKSSNKQDDGPNDDMLRQYFKFSIESDASEIYGDGFRQASRAYSEVGLEMLLNHVAYYRDFPET